MKQQEIFKRIIKKVQALNFLFIAIFAAFSLGLLLTQYSLAAGSDPKFFLMEQPVTSVAVIAGKRIPSVTFKVGAMSQNGQSWFASGGARPMIDIVTGSGVGDQTFELPSSGAGTVTFTNLIPNATYTIKGVVSEITADGYKKRTLPGDIGYFKAPDGDVPSQTAFISYAKTPEFFTKIEDDGVKTVGVRLYFKSTVDERDLFVRVTSTSNVSKTYSLDFIYKYEDEDDIENTPFQNLLWSTNYTVKVFIRPPGATTESLVATLPSFTTPTNLGGNTTTVKTTFSYSKEPQVSVVQQGTAKVSVATFSVVSDANEPDAILTITPAGGSMIAGASGGFTKGVARTFTFDKLSASTSYAVSVLKKNSAGTYTTITDLGTFKTLTGTTVEEPKPAQTTQPTPTPQQPSTDIGNTVARATNTGPTAKLMTTCTDGIDNDKDGRIDYYGTATAEPDPSCYAIDAEEIADDVAKGSLVPCTDKCGFSDVFKLLNNVLKFIITVLLIPIFVIMIMYIGFKYLTSQGNPAMHLKFKKMLWNMFLGVVIILSAWLIVRTILSTLGYADGLLFFQ